MNFTASLRGNTIWQTSTSESLSTTVSVSSGSVSNSSARDPRARNGSAKVRSTIGAPIGSKCLRDPQSSKLHTINLMPTNGCAKGGESERGNRERSRLSLTTGEGRGAKGEQGEVEAVLDHRRGARSEGGTGAVIRGRLRTRSRAADDVIGRMGMDANVRNGVSEGRRFFALACMELHAQNKQRGIHTMQMYPKYP